MQKMFAIMTLVALLPAGCSRQTLLYSNISTDQAEKMIFSNKGLIIVDVREDSEYSSVQGHVPGAINYPWSSGIFQQNFQKLDKSREIILVCRSGRRSQAAATFLTQKGYTKVYNILGGTNQWIKNGHKTDKSDN